MLREISENIEGIRSKDRSLRQLLQMRLSCRCIGEFRQ